jgi:hypothetical protein
MTTHEPYNVLKWETRGLIFYSPSFPYISYTLTHNIEIKKNTQNDFARDFIKVAATKKNLQKFTFFFVLNLTRIELDIRQYHDGKVVKVGKNE